MHFFNVLPLVGVENQLKFQFHLPCATHVSIRSDNLKLIIRHKFKLPPTLLPPWIHSYPRSHRQSRQTFHPRVVLSLQRHTIICLDSLAVNQARMQLDYTAEASKLNETLCQRHSLPCALRNYYFTFDLYSLLYFICKRKRPTLPDIWGTKSPTFPPSSPQEGREGHIIDRRIISMVLV